MLFCATAPTVRRGYCTPSLTGMNRTLPTCKVGAIAYTSDSSGLPTLPRRLAAGDDPYRGGDQLPLRQVRPGVRGRSGQAAGTHRGTQAGPIGDHRQWGLLPRPLAPGRAAPTHRQCSTRAGAQRLVGVGRVGGWRRRLEGSGARAARPGHDQLQATVRAGFPHGALHPRRPQMHLYR